jgi:hypothetical protein
MPAHIITLVNDPEAASSIPREIMIAVIAVLFMLFFRESDKEIAAIEVVDSDAALTQGEVK